MTPCLLHCRAADLARQLDAHVTAGTAAREAMEAANAALEATRQHAFELKVRSCWHVVVRIAPCALPCSIRACLCSPLP